MPNWMPLRSGNRCAMVCLFFVGSPIRNEDQETQRNANDHTNPGEHQMLHSRFLRSCGRSVECFNYAEAMPLRQRLAALRRETVRHPEILGLGLGNAGSDVALRRGAGPLIVWRIDNYFPLSDTHRHSQSKVRVSAGRWYGGS